jgi:hypothetical protein
MEGSRKRVSDPVQCRYKSTRTYPWRGLRATWYLRLHTIVHINVNWWRPRTTWYIGRRSKSRAQRGNGSKQSQKHDNQRDGR